MHNAVMRQNSVVKPTPWSTLWESFDRELQAIGRSHKTRETYQRSGERFARWLVSHDRPADPATVTRDDVVRYFAELRAEMMPAGVRLHWAALARFLGWLVTEGELERSPLLGLQRPVVDEPPPAILGDEDVSALLHACQGREFLDRRDAALIRFLVDTGARRAELLGLDLVDVDLRERTAVVLGKGNRRGLVFFGVKTARDLDRYLRSRARHPKAALPALWIGGKGRLGDDGLAQMLRRRAQMAGVDPDRVHPHSFRHLFAHKMKQAGASDEDVMTLGRWRDPSVMRRYGGAAALERAREAHRRLSPGDRL